MSRSPCADLRTIQLGKLGTPFPITLAGLRVAPCIRAESSWEVPSQLPPQHCAESLSGTQKPVGKAKALPTLSNLIYASQIRHLQIVSSCGGETTP